MTTRSLAAGSLALVCLFVILLPFKSYAQTNPAWTLVWSDEFSQPNGSSPDTNKWAFDTGAGGWGNSELENYTSRTNNARIQNGQLVIEARQESYQGANYTSARLKTQGKISWTYGRIEARIKIPRGQGIWPAFWTLGTNIPAVSWPTCGEVDIMENIGKEATIVHGTAHGPGYSGGNGIGGPYSLASGGAFADDFHIYALEWTTNALKWFVDGAQYFSVTPASLPTNTTWVFTQPQFVLLNVAVGGTWPGNPDGTTTFPQQMLVDYVRVYAATNLPVCNPNLLANPGFETGGLANWTTYGGNTYLEGIKSFPVHDGSNSFKVFGAFNGQTNYSGLYQDMPTSAGASFTAGIWALTLASDRIAGNNTAWAEVSFRNGSSNVLSLYRTASITSNTPAGAWLNLPVTNQLNPATFVLLSSVTNLVAPTNTSFVRLQVVFEQTANSNGSVFFDDLKLARAGDNDVLVPVSQGRASGNLNLAFPTYLGLPYELHWKAAVTDPAWTVLSNFVGDGTLNRISVDLQSPARFYRVTRLCN
jgi:beta-glucanase (GH16 family)